MATVAGPNVKSVPSAQDASGLPDLRAADAMGVSLARATYDLDGSGMKIGIISDSYNRLGGAKSDVDNGYLPAAGVKVLHDGSDPADDTDEGRAIAQLVHGIAPAAALDFCAPFGAGTDEIAERANAVKALQADGCKVIVDDLSSWQEPFYQPGDAWQAAITAFVNAGGDYFSAAGNDSGNYYERGFNPITATLPEVDGGAPVSAMSFDGGSSTSSALQSVSITSGGRAVKFALQWDQPFKSIGTDSPGAQNSLAMYLFDANGRLVASASSNKVGSDPVQELDYQNPAASGSSAFTLAIVQNGGASPPGQFKYIATGPATINDPNAHLGSGDIYGHEMMANTNVVGATGWADTPYNGVNPPKPESFTGYGPGEYLFDAQGNRLAQPQMLSEPDYTATDAPNTSMAGFSPFTGTSAAAPDAAAVAALVLQENPSLTPAQVKADLTRSAIYMGPAANVGAGLIQATGAAQLAHATPNDPLFQYQWGLQNTGQSGGTPGVDINVLPVWPQYTGAGVRVGVVDTGFQLAHPDLAKNVDAKDSFDAVTNVPGGNPVFAADNHGTPVAGIIGEAQNNGIGGSGVAPDATLISYRILGRPDANSDLDVDPNFQTPAVRAFSKALADNVDVLSNSWGFAKAPGLPAPFASNFSLSRSLGVAETALGTLGRNGKGGIAVFAAANDRQEGDDAEFSNQTSSRFSITVGALTNQGGFSSYSTPGASLLVAAPAGEYGSASVPSNTITAADRTSTDGYNKTPGTAGDYTYGFNGTSAATPFVSGVVALMLQANPNLGYRDVQEILAYTARNTDPSNTSWLTTAAGTWNGGGLHYSPDYGFGLVDAHAAVRLAESYATLGKMAASESNMLTGTAFDTPAAPRRIAGGGSITQTLAIAGGTIVNHVDLSLALTAPSAGALTVTLTSPDGTTVPLLASRSAANSYAWPVNFTLGTDAFWGEDTGPADQPTRNWTVTIQNTGTAPVAYAGSTLQVYGAPSIATDIYPGGVKELVYTDEFARVAAATPGRATIDTPITGSAVVNAAAVSGPIQVFLPQNRAVIDGQSVQITPGSAIGAVLGGDGNDTLVGSAGNQFFAPGRGSNVVTLGSGNDTDTSIGQDTITAGAGNDTINVTAGNLNAIGGTGRLTVGVSAGDASVQAGSGGTLVTGGAGRVTAWGRAAGDAFFGGTAGGNQLVAGAGAETLVGGGSGDLLVAARTGGDLLAAGSGNVTLTGAGSQGANSYFGGAGADFVALGGGSDMVVGGSGADTIFGGSGHADVFAGSGPTLVVAGPGGDYVQAGTGQATVLAGTGTDLFGFVSGHGGGTDLISGFKTSSDRILLQGFGADAVSSVLESARVVGDSTLVQLADNTQVTFANFTGLSRSVFV